MKKARLFLIIPVLFILTSTSLSFSQEKKKVVSVDLEEKLYKGELKAVNADAPSRVVVGNPEVADVISVSAQEIMVAGKGAGATNLIWWDALGEHHLRLRVFDEDMRDIQLRIDSLIKELNLPQVFTRTADSEGKVLLLGSVKNNEDMDRIKTALGLLFSRITNLIKIEEEKAIIALEVEIVEVNKDSTTNLGMDWLASGGSATMTPPVRFATRLAGIPDALIRVTEWEPGQLSATLDLLVNEGKARILSRPKLACQSGKEAELLVGGEKPIMNTSTSQDGSDTSITYKEYGIKLKMAPVLTAEDKIKLVLNVRVSDIGVAETLGTTTTTSATTGSSTITARAYPMTIRETSTQLYLKDGQTLAMSGLIRQKTEEDLKKMPWLGDIPVLGMFFRHRKTTQGGGAGERGDTELVIMVTPSVVKEKSSDKQIAEEEKIKAKKNESSAKDKKGVAKTGAKTGAKAARGEVSAKTKKTESATKTVKTDKPAVTQKKSTGAAAKPATTSGKKVEGKEVKTKNNEEVKPQNKGIISSKQKAEEKKELDIERTAKKVRPTPPVVKEVPKKEEIEELEEVVSQQASPVEDNQQQISPTTEYVWNVAGYLKNNIFYPWAAKRAELEGTVVLNLHLLNTGELLEAEINRSSGYSVLDENALRIAKQITPYPSFPQGINERELWVQIPIVYNLKE